MKKHLRNYDGLCSYYKTHQMRTVRGHWLWGWPLHRLGLEWGGHTQLLLLTVPVAVIDPLLPVLCGGGGLFHNSFFHNGTGILPGPFLQSP